jgi:hypothetical protein
LAKEPEWLNPPLVRAPAPKLGAVPLLCQISRDFIEKNFAIKRRTPIFQLWTHVVGRLPPIPHIDMLAHSLQPPDLMTLMEATACFQGVQRPYSDEPDGASVMVYVLAPRVSIAYSPTMACVARAVPVSVDRVLTVQVKPLTLQGTGVPLNGLVTRLEFVSSVGDSPALPTEHEGRYEKLHWVKP